jgi:hypothetical protein
MLSRYHCQLTIVLIAVAAWAGFGCAGKGLVTEKYDAEFYRVPRLLPEDTVITRQTFVVYSDNQTGWRAYDKFVRRENWVTPKMFIFPFYQLYLLGNGLIGLDNWIRHVPDYGLSERRMVRDAVYAEAKRSGAAFIMNVGDMSAHDGRRPYHWEIFLRENRVERPLLDEIPYLPVIGNHENANDPVYGFPNYEAIFDYPRFYTVELRDACLFVVDSNLLVDQKSYIPDDQQDELFERWFVSRPGAGAPSWLEEKLSSCNKPFKIVVMHHPMITCAKHSADWFDPANGRDLEEKRKQLTGLLERQGVSVVMSGHDHSYQHNVLRKSRGGLIHFLVGGGGGAPVRMVESAGTRDACRRYFKSVGMDVDFLNHQSIYHYYVIGINGGRMVIDVIEVTGEDAEPVRPVESIVIETRPHD